MGSGSRGNGTLVEKGSTRVLVDCGFTLRETERRLARLNRSPCQLTAILVTHEHSDHCNGVELLARRYSIPVYMSDGTARGLRKPFAPAGLASPERPLEIRDLQIRVVSVAHDAREPTQFVFSDGRRRLGLLTDLGSSTPSVVEHYSDLDALVMEANHDSDMLARGPYPYFLKNRVGGAWGHMNNHQAAALVQEVGWKQLQHLVLAHLSEKNNLPHLARQTFADTLGCDPGWLQVADQDSGLDWREIA
nr:MBL fold metallo-hydrolase [Pseudomonas sp. RIT-PI-AD]